VATICEGDIDLPHHFSLVAALTLRNQSSRSIRPTMAASEGVVGGGCAPHGKRGDGDADEKPVGEVIAASYSEITSS